jgi:acyl-[acyl carrier protein]--UDP-N-acetylglucosamine O-acyltransferase
MQLVKTVILEDNTIQPFTTIGNNVVMWSGNHIGHHGQIKDHVFFTSHVVLSGHCVVESYSFFGVNSTIRDYTSIAQGTLVGMASAITKETEEWSIYVGNPAKKVPGKKSFEAY